MLGAVPEEGPDAGTTDPVARAGVARLPEAFRAEIERFVATLPATASCVVTGSLIEGLGNPNSDLDLYVISDDDSPGRTTTIGIREASYVDCEHIKLVSVEQLRERVDTSGWVDVDGISLKDIDRYYRLTICVPVRVTPAAAKALARFRKATAAEALARHASLRTFEQLALSAYLHSVRSEYEADLLLRDAALWWATSRLAGVGEAYASVKWFGEKAARHYGRGSAEVDELVGGYMRPAGDLEARIRELRATISMPAELVEALERRACRLAERVQFLEAGQHAYLVKPGESIVQLDGAAVPVCRALAAGLPWREATDRTAEHLGLLPMEFRTAAWFETQQLRTHNFLV